MWLRPLSFLAGLALAAAAPKSFCAINVVICDVTQGYAKHPAGGKMQVMNIADLYEGPVFDYFDIDHDLYHIDHVGYEQESYADLDVLKPTLVAETEGLTSTEAHITIYIRRRPSSTDALVVASDLRKDRQAAAGGSKKGAAAPKPRNLGGGSSTATAGGGGGLVAGGRGFVRKDGDAKKKKPDPKELMAKLFSILQHQGEPVEEEDDANEEDSAEDEGGIQLNENFGLHKAAKLKTYGPGLAMREGVRGAGQKVKGGSKASKAAIPEADSGGDSNPSPSDGDGSDGSDEEYDAKSRRRGKRPKANPKKTFTFGERARTTDGSLGRKLENGGKVVEVQAAAPAPVHTLIELVAAVIKAMNEREGNGVRRRPRIVLTTTKGAELGNGDLNALIDGQTGNKRYWYQVIDERTGGVQGLYSPCTAPVQPLTPCTGPPTAL